ncbi:MAG: tRNA epoxyqueuosine(34) reductase QueG [Phycisphaerales bacterium]|nr:tRNA epoxyqueuosine(34) reductase QueG [Phycisphaerales bacterium]
MPMPDDVTTDLLARCREAGFALAGVAPCLPPARPEVLRAWLAAGHHGEMSYLDTNLDALLDPNRVLDGARSVICVADRYHTGLRDRPTPPGFGRIARYARGDDYHRVIKRRLIALCDDLAAAHPDASFRACVDTAPLLEREHAARAGLGAIGKHTLLIERGIGSYLLLGEILTTLDLAPTTSSADANPCGRCTRCLDACPTDAITPFAVDATKCISYLTIEHRGPIDAALHEAIGDWIFGCDICQEVCPHNQPTRRTRRAGTHAAYAPRRSGFDLLEVLGWDEDARRAAFTTSALKRAKLDMMKRNALIAAGNALRRADLPALRARLEAIAADESESDLVRETARTVLRMA